MFQSAPFGTVKRWIPGLSGYSRPEELEQLKIAPKPPPTLFSTVLRNQETVSDNFQHAQSLLILLFKKIRIGVFGPHPRGPLATPMGGCELWRLQNPKYRVLTDLVRLNLLDQTIGVISPPQWGGY